MIGDRFRDKNEVAIMNPIGQISADQVVEAFKEDQKVKARHRG